MAKPTYSERLVQKAINIIDEIAHLPGSPESRLHDLREIEDELENRCQPTPKGRQLL